MPTWKTFRRYLEHNGWECYRVTDHYHYRKGEERIKSSMGSGEIPAPIWRKILRRELKITQEEFNAGL